MALGPAGQWLSFRFQDLSKDTGGTFEDRLRPPEGSQWQLNTVALGYGANGAGGVIGPDETLVFVVDLVGVR